MSAPSRGAPEPRAGATAHADAPADDGRDGDGGCDGAAIPRLGRGVRLRVDRVNHKTLLLRPEQGFELRGSALDIVRLCDGQRTVDDIVTQLCATFSGGATPDRIAGDVRALLRRLAARRLIELLPAARSAP